MAFNPEPEVEPGALPQANPQRVKRGSILCLLNEFGLTGIWLALGLGSPDHGADLVRSGSIFDEVSGQIAALVPEDRWQGSAAQAYTSQNRAQSQRTQLMADLDRLAADLVAAQADAIAAIREILLDEIRIIACTYVICLNCELFMGPQGQLWSFRIATIVCDLAMIVVACCITYLVVTSYQNARSLQAATQSLTGMLAALPMSSDPPAGRPDVASPPLSSPLEFDAPELTPQTPQMPDAAPIFADLPGAPEFVLSALPTPGFPDFGAPHLPIPRLSGTPSMPATTAPPPGLVATLSRLTNTRRLSQLDQFAEATSGAAAGAPTDERAPVYATGPGQRRETPSTGGG